MEETHATKMLLMNVDNDYDLYREARRLTRALWDAEDQDIEPLAEALEEWLIGTYTPGGYVDSQGGDITLVDWYRQYGSIGKDVGDWRDVNWRTVALYYVDDVS